MQSDDEFVDIRAATKADAPTLVRLIEELAMTTGLRHKFRATADAYASHGFGERPRFEALIATIDGVAVGAAVYFYTFSSWRGEPGVYLQDIVVTGASRGRGIGRALMRRVAQEGQARGATHLHLAVDRENASAMAFYEQLGLKKVDDDVVYAVHGQAFADLAEVRVKG